MASFSKTNDLDTLFHLDNHVRWSGVRAPSWTQRSLGLEQYERVWRLFNATTFALNGKVAEKPDLTKQLHQIIDGVCETVHALMKYIDIEGKRYEWKEIRRLRRELIQAARKPQPTLFELREDSRHPRNGQQADDTLNRCCSTNLGAISGGEADGIPTL